METIAENIAVMYQDLDLEQNRKSILSHYLQIDESHLWPICSNFNATEAAIKSLNYFEDQYGDLLYGLELCLFLDNKLSEIVNQTV